MGKNKYLHASTGLAVYARLSIMVVSSTYNSIASFTFEGNVRPCSFINVSTISKNSKVAGGSGISVYCLAAVRSLWSTAQMQLVVPIDDECNGEDSSG